ncbi:MAG: tetratricopeptide repeat protein, partial [Planctomycetota bacterium]|nr:tetratricopeptide repeat protein [Planctomycetota bacterium]
RQRAKVLGVFHGEVTLPRLQMMMEWDEADVAGLGSELVRTGLATPAPYNHLGLNPALCPYQRAGLAADERDALTARWTATMRQFVDFLVQQRDRDAQLAATLTLLELPNAMALLDGVRAAGDPVETIALTTYLFLLVQSLSKPRVLAKIAAVRDAAEQSLGSAAWSHTQFEARHTRIEQQSDGGQFPAALAAARELHRRAVAAGEAAYADADYDLAMACILLGRVLNRGGRAGEALPLPQEAQGRFESIAASRDSRAAQRMARVSLTEQGDCLRAMGKLDAAAAAYEQAIERAKALEDARSVAVNKFQLGSVRYLQRRYVDALRAYEEARQTMAALDEPLSVATAWHQIGMVHQDDGRPEAAEQAYRQALAIRTQEGDVKGQADSLTQLGNLYADVLHRLEDAASFDRQAADKYVAIGDLAFEGRSRNNLADTLRQLGRFDEARTESQPARRRCRCFGRTCGGSRASDLVQVDQSLFLTELCRPDPLAESLVTEETERPGERKRLGRADQHDVTLGQHADFGRVAIGNHGGHGAVEIAGPPGDGGNGSITANFQQGPQARGGGRPNARHACRASALFQPKCSTTRPVSAGSLPD